ARPLEGGPCPCRRARWGTGPFSVHRRRQCGRGPQRLFGPELAVQRGEVEVRGILEQGGEVGGVAQAAAVLGWGGAATAGRAGRGRTVRGLPHGLHDDRDVPAVTVVVEVLEPVTALLQQLAEAYLVGGHALVLALVDIELAQELLGVRIER